MHKAFAWIKQHPLTLVLIIGVGILVIVLFSGDTSGTVQSAMVAAGPSDADVAASTSLAQTQVAASTSLTGQANQNSFQLAEDTIAANASSYNANLGAAVSLAGINAGQTVDLANIQGQVQMADIQNTANVQVAGIQAGVANNAIVAQETENLAPYTAINSLAANGGLKQLTTQKDAYLNLPGLQIGRATNYTAPGASGQNNNNPGAAISSVVGSVAGAFSNIFG